MLWGGSHGWSVDYRGGDKRYSNHYLPGGYCDVGYIDWAMERDGGYTKENAIAYSDMMCARPNWHYDRYGDKEYVEHV